ncbi:hypothetical protein LDENG_00216050 [Lucifuga dentata]|nr:hypothetical protein LDENG_00216050 [Lucifuga dentata]
MKHLLLFGVAFALLHISHSTIPDFCHLNRDEGEGTSFSFAVYYDVATDLCYPFMYKGQGGNENRFNNEIECIRNCSANAENTYPMDVTKACHFRKRKGGCEVKVVRYYYDSFHDKCKTFIWHGCYGNGNRFPDQETCNATCAGIHDDSEEEEEAEPDTPIAIICGVVIGIIAAIILIAVVVLTVKSKNKPKKAPKKSKDPAVESPLQDQGIEMA